MENTFIKLFRSLLDWEWYSDNSTKALFIHCLLKANFKDKTWRGIEIKRGSFLTSLESLATETGLSVQNIRTSLRKLISTNELTSTSTNRYRIVTLKNYDKYNAVTSKQQTTNKQLTTTKKEKKVIKEKEKDIYLEFVLLQKVEYDKLIDKYGDDITTNIIETLNNYLGSTGKKYKSHYHTILNWLKRDKVETLEEKAKLFSGDDFD